MTVELITTGSELLLGRILNSHLQWLGRQLADLGLPIVHHATVPDTSEAIQAAVRESLSRADLVVTTGGLGPTSDDVTRERIAELLGRRLTHRPEVEASIRRFFESRGRSMPTKTRVEAFVPEGADILFNLHGTAPGLAMELDPNPLRPGGRRSGLILLPGPPRELHPMFTNAVRPWLADHGFRLGAFECRSFKTTGLGESLMEERLEAALQRLVSRGLTVGYCARVGEVEVRLSAEGPDAVLVVDEAEAVLRERAGEFIFGIGDDSLETVLVSELTRRHNTLALAESCTGGHLANRITNVPGASAVLLAGFVPYSNEAKSRMLGVPPDLIIQHGAVSEAVARSLAEGARRATGADYAVSTTGIAGPSGGTEDKPVGTVFIGVSGPEGTEVFRNLNRFDRETFKFVTAQQGFDRLRRMLSRPPQSA